MFQIPNKEKNIKQFNDSDLKGNIFITKNINFDDSGYAKLSSGAMLFQDADVDFDDTGSMFLSDRGLGLLSDDFFTTTRVEPQMSLTNQTTDEGAPSPGPEEDGTFFNGEEIVSDGTSVERENGGTWLAVVTGLNASSPTCLANFEGKAGLLVGNDNEVYLVNTSWATAQTLTIPAEFVVTSIDTNGATAYVGTRHIVSGEAMLYTWDGNGTAALGAYGCGAYEISSVKAYKDSVVCFTPLGQLLRFNGGGFTELAKVSPYNADWDWGDANNDYAILSNRGMNVRGDRIFLNLKSRLTAGTKNFDYTLPGGVWCYDPAIGLYHRNAHTKNVITEKIFDSTDVNTTTNEITIASGAPETGEVVFLERRSGSAVGLEYDTWYYAIKVSDTVIKLATSYSNAQDDVEVDIISVAVSAWSIWLYTQNDWGDIYTNDRVSLINLANDTRNDKSVERLVYSTWCFNKTMDSSIGLALLHKAIPNRGYIVTPLLESESTEDLFKSILIKFTKLKQGDEIHVKVKTEKKVGLPTEATDFGNQTNSTEKAIWTSSTVFTTLEDLSMVVAGDEIEVVGGQGAGHIAHVSTITESSGTYTVTIDDGFANVTNGDKMIFIANNWTYLGKADYQTKNDYKVFRAPTSVKSGKYSQIKVELRGTGVVLEEMIINNKSDKPVV